MRLGAAGTALVDVPSVDAVTDARLRWVLRDDTGAVRSGDELRLGQARIHRSEAVPALVALARRLEGVPDVA